MKVPAMSGNQLLGNGLETITNSDEFRKAMDMVSENAFAKIFEAQDKGRLRWKRAGDNLTDLVTEIVVRDGRDREIAIPVILFVGADEVSKVGYLVLGSRHNAPCRNTVDSRVRRLYMQLTGETL